MPEAVTLTIALVILVWVFGRLVYSTPKLSSHDKETIAAYSDRLIATLSKALHQEVEVISMVSGNKVVVDVLIGSGFDAVRREIKIPHDQIQNMSYWSQAAQTIIREFQPT